MIAWSRRRRRRQEAAVRVERDNPLGGVGGGGEGRTDGKNYGWQELHDRMIDDVRSGLRR